MPAVHSAMRGVGLPKRASCVVPLKEKVPRMLMLSLIHIELGDADVDDHAQHQRRQHVEQQPQADARVAQGDLRRFFALSAIQRDTPFPRRS